MPESLHGTGERGNPIGIIPKLRDWKGDYTLYKMKGAIQGTIQGTLQGTIRGTIQGTLHYTR